MREPRGLIHCSLVVSALLIVAGCKKDAPPAPVERPAPVTEPAPRAPEAPVEPAKAAAEPPKPEAVPARGAPALGEAMDRVKAATVLIRTSRATGSGFVALQRNEALYIVTNHHVVAAAMPDGDVGVTFRPGLPDEWSGTASIVGANTQRDLALLKTSGPPKPPLPLEGATEARELMPVVAVGFPFGDALAANGHSPSATLSRASISAIRQGPLGVPEVLQLDNNLNPGNSGGPIVDDEGRVVGVSVAALRGTGIGFGIPFEQARALLEGRSAVTKVKTPRSCAHGCKGQVEVSVIDPFHKTRQVELRVIEADAQFKSERRAPPFKAEGRLMSSAKRPESGALTLYSDLNVDPSKRLYLQIGYATENSQTVYDVPFEVAPTPDPADEEPPPTTERPDRRAEPAPDEAAPSDEEPPARAGPDLRNIASEAQVEASSNFNPCHTERNAVDQRPIASECSEWASKGQGAGAWIKLRFRGTHKVAGIILHDRANPDDHILDATLTLNGHQALHTGELPNDGSGKVFRVKPMTIEVIELRVNSSAGPNIGLSEIEVIGT